VPTDTTDAYSFDTATAVASSKVTTQLVIAAGSIDQALAGNYMCAFIYDDDDTYESNSALIVRLVTTEPTAAVWSYTNANYVMTCLLDSSDAAIGVTWTGPGGEAIDSGAVPTVDGNNYILSLTNPTAADSGAYTCTFAYATGAAPVATITGININLVTMLSPAVTYSTIGTTVTFSCEVVSNVALVLTFWDGTTDNSATTITYDESSNGKTKALYVISVTGSTVDATYTCRKSATEHSTAAAALDVFGKH